MQKSTPQPSPQPTKHQQAALAAIYELSMNGRPPSWSELAKFLDRSPNAVKNFAIRLQLAGFVDYKRGEHRSLRLTQLGHQNLAAMRVAPGKVTSAADRRKRA